MTSWVIYRKRISLRQSLIYLSDSIAVLVFLINKEYGADSQAPYATWNIVFFNCEDPMQSQIDIEKSQHDSNKNNQKVYELTMLDHF